MNTISPTCTHIYDTGGTCKSFAVQGQRYCVHHLRYRARRLRAARARARGERFQFNLPPLESMHAVHSALSQLAEAIACGVIDSRSARDLLSVLRIASSNLRHPEKWRESLYHSDEPAREVDVAAEYGLPADLDLDTPPDVAFPANQNSHGVILSEEGAVATAESKDPFVPANSRGLAGAPPFSTASAGDRVGKQTGDSFPEMPLSGHYCGDHHSRECECCRIRADYPLTPEMVEVVEVSQTYGPEVAAARSKQLMRNTERRHVNRERKRYAAIALEKNMRRAAEIMAERKLAERATHEESAAGKPPTPAATLPSFDTKSSQMSELTPTG
jgi:hypothetical protein